LAAQYQHGHDCVPMVAPGRRIEFRSDPTPEEPKHRRIWPMLAMVPLHRYFVGMIAPTVDLLVSSHVDR
jgi:hypothetical protein